ncbi:ABC transporter substrate-binding protein [Bifidobacterium sp. MA2]|uniref:ABC transporter substrate-binding protein n=1 Tax=Bifidobacterium santillanense TaxID=2809028 RepID=A0ABS5UNA9_9BIFI|nr:ABC transporter substrate-binding protein [Bifidobacterium santillanense]MBT1172400.1 ABC transporter substrate-binding protein [Bifidobacterium santillanense]
MGITKGLKTATAAILSAAMLFAAAACGTTDSSDTASSSGDKSGSSSSSSSTKGFDTSSIKKDDEIAALLPDSVTKDGVLTVGTDTSYAPAEFLAADGKTPVGFDVDLSKALAAVFGLKENTVTSTFDSIIPSVGSKYDLGISSFTVTKDRLDAVDFVTYFKAGSTFVVQKGNPNKVDTSDLCGKKVAVQTGTTQEEEVNKDNDQCKADGKSEIDIQSSKLQTDVTTAVASGKADVFYADSPVAGYAISQTGDTLEALGEDVGVAPEAVAIKKGDSATVEAVQKAIQKLMDDGTYQKILDTWGVSSGAVDKPEVNPAAE